MGRVLKLVDLKVAQLRSELIKRGYEKTGIKAVLVERLKKALEKEGHDPLLFEFTDSEDGNESFISEDDASQKENERSTPLKSENDDKTSGSTLVANESVTSLSSLSSVPPAPADGILTVQDVINLKSQEKLPDDYSVIVQVDETESLKLDVPESTTMESSSPKNEFNNETKENGDRPSENEKKETDKKDLSDSPNLWVTNINDTVSAVDLKQLFSDYGKVISAKIVVNAKTDPPKRFGYLQMSSASDADKCIQRLTDYELEGQAIQIKKAKNEPSSSKKSDKSKTESKEVPPENDKKEKRSSADHFASIKKLERRPTRNYRTLKNAQPLISSRPSRSYAEILAAKKKATYGIRRGVSNYQRNPAFYKENYRQLNRQPERALLPTKPQLVPYRRLPIIINTKSYRGTTRPTSMRGSYNSNLKFSSMRLKEFKDMGFTDRDAYYALKREKFMHSKSSAGISERPYRRNTAPTSSRLPKYSEPYKKQFYSNPQPSAPRREMHRPSHQYEGKHPRYDRDRNYTAPRFHRSYEDSSHNSKYQHREYSHERPKMTMPMHSRSKPQNFYTESLPRNTSYSGAYSDLGRYSRTSNPSYHSQSRSNYQPPSQSRSIHRSMDMSQRDYKKRYRTHPYMGH